MRVNWNPFLGSDGEDREGAPDPTMPPQGDANDTSFDPEDHDAEEQGYIWKSE